MINITLKDGSSKEYPKGITVNEVAQDISKGLARVAVAAQVDDKTVDLMHPLNDDCLVNILTFDDKEGKKAFWHTSAHIMAQAD